MANSGSPLHKLGVYMELIYTFPAAILLPSLGGWWLDRKLGTQPWLTLLGLFLGIAAGFTYLFKSLTSLEKKRRGGGEKGSGAP